jgi:hypothetical protein
MQEKRHQLCVLDIEIPLFTIIKPYHIFSLLSRPFGTYGCCGQLERETFARCLTNTVSFPTRSCWEDIIVKEKLAKSPRSHFFEEVEES